jgi:hypothetical protein
MKDVLDEVGATYCFRQYPGGRHNERAWAQRIDKPLQFLLSSSSSDGPVDKTLVNNIINLG